MDLDAEKVVFTMNIIDLDTEISSEKAMVALIFEINSSGIHIAKVLINQNTIELF